MRSATSPVFCLCTLHNRGSNQKQNAELRFLGVCVAYAPQNMLFCFQVNFERYFYLLELAKHGNILLSLLVKNSSGEQQAKLAQWQVNWRTVVIIYPVRRASSCVSMGHLIQKNEEPLKASTTSCASYIDLVNTS